MWDGMDIEDIQRLARWWFCRDDRRKRRSMWAATEAGGSIDDLVHEVVIALWKHPPPRDVNPSTAVCNQCLWVSGSLLKLAKRRRDTMNGFDPGTDHYETGRIAESNEMRTAIFRVLKTLSYREREIIKLRYGLEDGYNYSLEQTARIFRVTRERIRQIESKALLKMSHFTRSRHLKGFT